MSNENDNQADNSVEQQDTSATENTIDYAAIQAEIERLKQHNEKLIGEKRQRDEIARQAQLEREQIEREAAKKNGDYEALEKSYQEKLQAREAELNELYKQRDTQSINSESQRLAAQLADSATNQRLLQRFIKDRLTVNDGQVKVTDENGNLSANTIDDLANEFKASGLYDSLLSGTRASGTNASGNAAGATKSASEYSEAERIELAKTNQAEFNRLFGKS